MACLVFAISVAAPFTASGQVADSGHADPRTTVLSIQPLFEGRGGPRLELERAVAARFSLVAGSRLTLRQADFIERFPRLAGVDLGIRYYAAGGTSRGPYAGVYTGYDRHLEGLYADRPDQVSRFFLGGTLGYDFKIGRRLVIGPAVGAEYGRPSPATGVKTWEVHPRLGIGFKFD